MKSLEAIAELNAPDPLELVPTSSALMRCRRSIRNDRAGYLRLVREDMLPHVARCGLAEFCDVFCETGVFSVEGIGTTAARPPRAAGLRLKVHADELTTLGGAELAARLGAVSGGSSAVCQRRRHRRSRKVRHRLHLLPGTAMFLRMQYAPARKLIERGVVVPGQRLQSRHPPPVRARTAAVRHLACTQMGMLPSEAIAALTLNGAAALGRSDRLGSNRGAGQARRTSSSVMYRTIDSSSITSGQPVSTVINAAGVFPTLNRCAS